MSRVAGKILISVTGWDAGEWVRELRALAPGHEVVTEPGGDADPSIRYALVWKPPSGILSRLPGLKVIFSLGAGVDHLLGDDTLPDLPIVRIVADNLTMRMSEYVVWRVLDHARQGSAYRALQAERRWTELRQAAASEITVGIMGLGVLGADAAAKLSALGFQVAGWSRSSKRLPEIDCYQGTAGLETFLATSDIVVVLLPLTEATRGIIDARLLGAMKQETPLGGPVLINAGRGGLQVEADILAALETGRLMAASLDVFETEPLPQTSPLWNHPGVTVTPHAAASSDPGALLPQVLRQIEIFERGEQLTGLVDREDGY